MNFLRQFIVTLFAIFMLEVIWLNFIIDGQVEWPAVYHFGYLPNWHLANFYLCLMATWITFRFALQAMQELDYAPALMGGAGLGIRVSVLYAAVNMVFFTPWPLSLILLDILWNTFAFAFAAVLSTYAGHWLQVRYPENNVQRS